MFASRYFNPRYWASRFWAKVGSSITVFTGPSCDVQGRIDKIGESVKVALDITGEAVQSSQIGEFALQSNLDINGQLIRVSLDVTGQSLTAIMDITGIAVQGNIKE